MIVEGVKQAEIFIRYYNCQRTEIIRTTGDGGRKEIDSK